MPRRVKGARVAKTRHESVPRTANGKASGKQTAYCLFETPLGSCGIAWNQSLGSQPVVKMLHLPERTEKMTDATMARRCGVGGPSVPPAAIAAIIDRIQNHLDGNTQDFQDVPLDLDNTGYFARRVYEAARRIPAGQTKTYGELARAVNRPRAARAVGQALGHNPIAVLIPCHRILAAGGKPGGFSAHGGRLTKARMLAAEGTSLSSRSHRERGRG
jgi:O-6-methylguanine DNA methyltransferase